MPTSSIPKLCMHRQTYAEYMHSTWRDADLDLDADLLDTEEEEGDDEFGRDGRPVVPRLAQLACSA